MITKVGELLAKTAPDISKFAQMKPHLWKKLDLWSMGDKYQGTLHVMVVKLEEWITSKNIRHASAVTAAAATATLTTISPAMATSRHHPVKLPKLTIHPFGRDLIAYITFWDSYKAAIHDNRSLSPIDKFNYLWSFLECSALDVLAGLTLTAANYKVAVDVLEKQFGNKQQSIAKHMEALYTEAMPSTCNVNSLQVCTILLNSTSETSIRSGWFQTHMVLF